MPTYILNNEDTQPAIRAIGVSHTACKDEFRQNLRSHSWSVFSFFIILEICTVQWFQNRAGMCRPAIPALFHSGQRHYSTDGHHSLFPYAPSAVIGTVASNRRYSTGAVEGPPPNVAQLRPSRLNVTGLRGPGDVTKAAVTTTLYLILYLVCSIIFSYTW